METKPFYNSVTLQGVLVTLLGYVLTSTSIPVVPDELDKFIGAAIVLIGVVASVIGRIRANTTLKLK